MFAKDFLIICNNCFLPDIKTSNDDRNIKEYESINVLIKCSDQYTKLEVKNFFESFKIHGLKFHCGILF